jgi:hypothetical protein
MQRVSDSASLAVLFGQSLLIGLSIAAPVGPIGLLTIQRTLQLGPAPGVELPQPTRCMAR